MYGFGLNNRVEADHGKLKRLINPVRGFQSMKTAYATIKGFEVMYMFKKGQFKFWQYGQGLVGEIRLITNCLLDFQLKSRNDKINSSWSAVCNGALFSSLNASFLAA